MSEKLSKNTFKLSNCPSIISSAAIVGKKEGQGPLRSFFDDIHEDTTLGQDSWEKAESELQKETIEAALEKADLTSEDIDLLFAGDLLNQCIGSTFGLRDLEIPFYGLYGACSTMGESLGLASIMVDNGLARNVVGRDLLALLFG